MQYVRTEKVFPHVVDKTGYMTPAPSSQTAKVTGKYGVKMEESAISMRRLIACIMSLGVTSSR